jgi:hypothetical protein
MCLFFIEMHVIYICVCECSVVVALLDLLMVGDVTIWYQRIVKCLSIGLPGLLVVGDVTIWYHSMVSTLSLDGSCYCLTRQFL